MPHCSRTLRAGVWCCSLTAPLRQSASDLRGVLRQSLRQTCPRTAPNEAADLAQQRDVRGDPACADPEPIWAILGSNQ
jgi:hypothetical protein